MKGKIYINTYGNNYLWIMIDSELLEFLQCEAQDVFPQNTTAQKHYVNMGILAMLLYNGNHSMTYHNTYISSAMFKALTDNYIDILLKHRIVLRTNNNGKPKYEDCHSCGYTIDMLLTKQGKMHPYKISGTNRLFEAFCLSIIETLESENGEMQCSTLEEVVKNIFEIKNKKALRECCDTILQYKKIEIDNYYLQLKELTQPIIFDPNSTFEQRYSYLYFSDEIHNMDIKRRHIPTIISYLKHQPASHKEDEKYLNEEDYNENRYYHSFHRTPKVLREYVMFNGDKLVEAFDVHQCFYVLMCKLMENCDKIDYDELIKYEILVGYGDLYTTILRYFKTQEEYANNEILLMDNKAARNYIKKEIQRWRNMLPNMVNSQDGIIKWIDMFYQTYFPTIRDFVLNYHIEKQKKRVNYCSVKLLQCDCIKIETDIMSHKVCKRLKEEYGIYALTLHDGVYIRMCDKKILDNKGVDIETIFWQELNLLIDQSQLEQVV